MHENFKQKQCKKKKNSAAEAGEKKFAVGKIESVSDSVASIEIDETKHAGRCLLFLKCLVEIIFFYSALEKSVV